MRIIRSLDLNEKAITSNFSGGGISMKVGDNTISDFFDGEEGN